MISKLSKALVVTAFTLLSVGCSDRNDTLAEKYNVSKSTVEECRRVFSVYDSVGNFDFFHAGNTPFYEQALDIVSKEQHFFGLIGPNCKTLLADAEKLETAGDSNRLLLPAIFFEARNLNKTQEQYTDYKISQIAKENSVSEDEVRQWLKVSGSLAQLMKYRYESKIKQIELFNQTKQIDSFTRPGFLKEIMSSKAEWQSCKDQWVKCQSRKTIEENLGDEWRGDGTRLDNYPAQWNSASYSRKLATALGYLAAKAPQPHVLTALEDKNILKPFTIDLVVCLDGKAANQNTIEQANSSIENALEDCFKKLAMSRSLDESMKIAEEKELKEVLCLKLPGKSTQTCKTKRYWSEEGSMLRAY